MGLSFWKPGNSGSCILTSRSRRLQPPPPLQLEVGPAVNLRRRPGRRVAALAAAAACRCASADHRPGEGEAEAGVEEAAMAAKRIGGSGARGWGGS